MITLAISLVLLYLIAIPGFISINAYYTYQSETLKFKPSGSKFALAVSVSIICHIIWLKTTSLVGYQVSYPLLVDALSPASKEINGLKSWISYKSLFDVGSYFTSLYITCFILAKLLQRAVLHYRIDLKLTFLSFENPLVYRLMGRTADFSVGDFDGVAVSATVEHDDSTFLYTGFLVGCPLDDNGDPKQLILQGASRRKFENDKQETEAGKQLPNRFYRIDGHYFVLEYSKISTLNLSYIIVSTKKKS